MLSDECINLPWCQRGIASTSTISKQFKTKANNNIINLTI